MTTPEPKPCPYCGAVDGVEICWYRALSPDVYAAIRCSKCGTRGPNQGTNIKAVDAWNNMARNYELDEMVVELGKYVKTIRRLAKALRAKNRALALAQRECKYAQERAAQKEVKE